MKKLLTMIGAAAVLPFAVSAAWSTETYTTTTNGVTWTYKVDAEAGKVLLGGSTTEVSTMVATTTAGVLYIPSTLVHEGTTYQVTDYGYGALRGCTKLTGVVIPETTFALNVGTTMFRAMSACVSIWFKGPATVTSGEQPLADVETLTNLFWADSALRAVVVGPNVTYSARSNSYPPFRDCSNVRAFLPKTYWYDKDITFGGTDCKQIFYGPGEDIDISIDGTFTVATAERLDDVLSVANDLHTYCGMNPKINVTNVIEVADVSITAAKLAFLDSGTFNSLVFKVTTQAQLRTLLDTIPSSVPFAIDPSDAREELTVDQGRVVYVRLSADGRQGKYMPKINGLIISFH